MPDSGCPPPAPALHTDAHEGQTALLEALAASLEASLKDESLKLPQPVPFDE